MMTNTGLIALIYLNHITITHKYKNVNADGIAKRDNAYSGSFTSNKTINALDIECLS